MCTSLQAFTMFQQIITSVCPKHTTFTYMTLKWSRLFFEKVWRQEPTALIQIHDTMRRNKGQYLTYLPLSLISCYFYEWDSESSLNYRTLNYFGLRPSMPGTSGKTSVKCPPGSRHDNHSVEAQVAGLDEWIAEWNPWGSQTIWPFCLYFPPPYHRHQGWYSWFKPGTKIIYIFFQKFGDMKAIPKKQYSGWERNYRKQDLLFILFF